MSNVLNRTERVYLVKQGTDLRTIPNTSGAANVTVANRALHKSLTLEPVVDKYVREDKTGSLSGILGVSGRRKARWSMAQSLVGNATLGSLPPHDPLFTSLFGRDADAITGTVAITGATNATPIVITAAAHGLSNWDVCRIAGVGGNTAANGVWAVNNVTTNSFELVGSTGNAAFTSGGTVTKTAVRYKLSSNDPLVFALFHYMNPVGAQQEIGLGLHSNQATFNLGQNIADWNVSGEGVFVIDKPGFSSLDTEVKGALSAFPNEPSGTATADSGVVAGYKGRLVLDGTNALNVRTATVSVNNQAEFVANFGSDYPNEIQRDERQVRISLTLGETDDAYLFSLYQKALAGTPIDSVIQVGTIASKTFVFVARGIELVVPGRDGGQRVMTRNFNDCRVVGTGNDDELALWIL